jgi:hypothetical protein
MKGRGRDIGKPEKSGRLRRILRTSDRLIGCTLAVEGPRVE